MKLLLKQFGTYNEKGFEFPSNQFVLFQGENGSGKSTIFKAICWVLYDKHKTIQHGHENCQVTMSNDKYKIKRVSKPKQLKVEFEGTIYEGAIAQEIITDKIMNMNWDQFLLSTMINTNSRCSLATITPNDRFLVIRQLVSTLNTPKVHIEKLNAYETSQKQLTTMIQGEISAYSTTLQRLTKNTPNINCKTVKFDQEEFDNVESKLQQLVSKKQKYLEILSKGMTKDRAQEKLDQLNSVESIEKKIVMFKQNLQYVKNINAVENLKSQFEKGKKEHFKQLAVELKNLRELELDDEETLLKKARECEIRKNAHEDGNEFWDKTPDEILEAHKGSFVASLKKTKQPCPHCSELVAIDDEMKIVSFDKKWNKIKTSTADFTKLLTLQYEWDSEAKSKWEKAVKTNMRIKELDRLIKGQILSNELIRMKKSFGEKISPPKTFKETYSEEYLQERIEKLTKQLGSCPNEDERDFLESIIAIKKFPTQEQIDTLEEQIKDCQEQFDALKIKEKAFRDYQMVQHVKEEIISCKKEISEKEKKLKEINNVLIGIDRLRQLQRDAELKSTENIVETINAYATEYLEKFFDEMIKVEMIFKQKSKSIIDIDVEKSGQTYKIDEFSQGELIKINLAFILAMNRLQNSKFLFLDEVLQNLDKDILLEIYSCLKSLTDSISIFVIQHNSIEGFFDKTIEFVKEKEVVNESKIVNYSKSDSEIIFDPES